MQSNKTSSRKPREAAADVAGQLPETNAGGPVAKARKTAASAPPKKMSKAAAPVKRHRATTTAVSDVVAAPVKQTASVEQAAQAEVGEMATAPKAMAMAAGSGADAGLRHSDAVDSVGNITEPQAIGTANVPASEKAPAGLNTEEVARLAHSYWVARGHRHGSHEEDWLRAEQELKR